MDDFTTDTDEVTYGTFAKAYLDWMKSQLAKFAEEVGPSISGPNPATFTIPEWMENFNAYLDLDQSDGIEYPDDTDEDEDEDPPAMGEELETT